MPLRRFNKQNSKKILKRRKAETPSHPNTKTKKNKQPGASEPASSSKIKSEPKVTDVKSAPPAAAELPKVYKFILADLIVVLFLWSFEIIYTVTEGWKASYFLRFDIDGKALIADEEDDDDELVNLLLPKASEKTILLILTLIAMAVVATVSLQKVKLKYLVAGTCVYLLTPILGFLATIVKVPGLVEAMLFVQIGWSSVNPLRYWLIFYQILPQPSLHSRIITAGCELVIFTTEYLMAIWVSFRSFSPLTYSKNWPILFVSMAIWIGIIHFIKRIMYSVDWHMAVVVEEYEKAQMMESYFARQSQRHIALFLCILVPSVMIFAQKSTVYYMFDELQNELPQISLYRVDLLFSIMGVAVVTAILCSERNLRVEVLDPAVIGIAHVLNVLVIAILLLQTIEYNTNRVVTVFNDARPYLELPLGVSFNTFIFGRPDIVFLVNDERGPATVGYGTRTTKNGTKFKVSLANKDGTRIFEESVTASGNTAYFYKKGKLTVIKDYFSTYKPMSVAESVTLWIVTGFDPCPNEPKEDRQGTRFLLKKVCHSVQIEMEFLDGDRNKLGNSRKQNVPLLGEAPQFGAINMPDGVRFIKLEITLDGSNYVKKLIRCNGTRERFAYFYLILYILESGDEEKIEFFSYNARTYVIVDPSHTPAIIIPPLPLKHWASYHGTTVICVLCVASLAVAVATVSYIHFIWIQCPWKYRTLILALFFALNSIGLSLPDILLTNLNPTEFIILLICHFLGCTMHVVASVYYTQNLRPLADSEKGLGPNMMF